MDSFCNTGYKNYESNDEEYILLNNLDELPTPCKPTSKSDNKHMASSNSGQTLQQDIHCMPETSNNMRRNHLPGKSSITHTSVFKWSTKLPVCDPSVLPNHLLKPDQSKRRKYTGRPISDLVAPPCVRSPPVDLVSLNKSTKHNSVGGVKMPIAGVTIQFPYEPYPVQKYMICQLVSAMKTATHCLLESPTGTGKTLALLCSALAWQQQEEELLLELKAEASSKSNGKSKEASVKVPLSKDLLNKQQECNISSPVTVVSATDSSDDDIFQSPKRKKKSFREEVVQVPDNHSDMSLKHKTMDAIDDSNKSDKLEKGDNPVDNNEIELRVPKIFYGTRTHKQITQVVEQLRKTVYASKVKMTILASRDHTCVNQNVCTRPNITEECRILVDSAYGIGCSYHTGASKYGNTHYSLQAHQLPVVYDIEDIIKVGKRNTLCPYFSLRHLLQQSDIIFCPYNYLIDPIIRESMNINVSKSVVIMDEAHNIEEACREAGSLMLKQQELLEAIDACTEKITSGPNAEEYSSINNFLVSLEKWLYANGAAACYLPTNESKMATRGEDLIINLEMDDITQERFQQMKDSVSAINQSRMEFSEANEALSTKVKLITSSITVVLNYLFKPENTKKYQAYFLREVSQSKQPQVGSWLSNHRSNDGNHVWQFNLHIICLSPTLVFSELLNARSIILASGTLSPLDTFQSELGVKFPHVVKGWHVVPKENLFVSVVESGPRMVTFKGVYTNVNTYEYQDELGNSILETAKVVPHGVLCFVPSYVLMEKLRDRWSSTGLLGKLAATKELFWEPRKKLEMDCIMAEFTNRIAISVDDPEQEIGALLFGVFRGKIAEGIDFSDASARAVISVGIPYMNMQAKEISLKIKYNDENISQNLLPGKQWYRIQAYRALNQALGRCIRHQNDWGAIILMDSRISSESKTNLPKWIQQQMKRFQTWDNYVINLKTFCQNMTPT